MEQLSLVSHSEDVEVKAERNKPDKPLIVNLIIEGAM